MKKETKTMIKFVLGGLMLVSIFGEGQFDYISNWSTAELVGFNITVIGIPILGLFLIYSAVRDRK